MSFGLTLRDWRQKRRHSQLSLGLEADISARHICFLETGKSLPSRDMVGRLCDVLDVPRADRNTLLAAAGFTQAFKERDWNSSELESIRSAMSHMLDSHNPYPGFALNRHWELIQMNASAQTLFGALGISVGDSMLDALIKEGPVSQSIVNLSEVKSHMRARLQVESTRYGGDEILDSARRELDSTGALAAETAAVVPINFSFNGLEISLFTVLAHFSSAEDIAIADIKIELLFPANPQSETILRSMTS